MIEFNLNLWYVIRYAVSKKSSVEHALDEGNRTDLYLKIKYVRCEKKTPDDFGSLEAQFLFG